MMSIFYSQQWLLFDVVDIEYYGYYEIDIWIVMYLFVWYWSTLILPIYSNDWFCCEEWIMYLRWMDDDRIEIYMYWYKCDKKWMDVINDICDCESIWIWESFMIVNVNIQPIDRYQIDFHRMKIYWNR